MNTVYHVGCGASLPPWATYRVQNNNGIIPADWISRGWLLGAQSSYFRLCFPEAISACAGISHHDVLDQGAGHVPLLSFRANLRYVTMLRSPRQRLISAHYHRSSGCSGCMHGNSTLESYVLQPRSATPLGCVTKMLVGRGCGSAYPLAQDVLKAVSSLRRFTFVGITDRWAESMCLATRVLGGPGQVPLPVQFINTRAGSGSGGGASSGTTPSTMGLVSASPRYDESALLEIEARNPRAYDTADFDVWEAGLALFQQQQREHAERC